MGKFLDFKEFTLGYKVKFQVFEPKFPSFLGTTTWNLILKIVFFKIELQFESKVLPHLKNVQVLQEHNYDFIEKKKFGPTF